MIALIIIGYFGLIGLLFLVIGGIGNGAFLDIPSMIAVFGLTGCSTLISWGRLSQCSIQGLELADALLASASRAALASGLLAACVGAILLLQNIDDPASIGPGLAITLTAPSYGALIYLLISPLRIATK